MATKTKKTEDELIEYLKDLFNERASWDRKIDLCLSTIKKRVKERHEGIIKTILNGKSIKKIDISKIKPDQWRWILGYVKGDESDTRNNFCGKLLAHHFDIYVYGGNLFTKQYNIQMYVEIDLDKFYKGFLKLRPFLNESDVIIKGKTIGHGIKIQINNDGVGNPIAIYDKDRKCVTMYFNGVNAGIKEFRTFRDFVNFIKKRRSE